MNKKFARKLKSELAITLAKAMDKKGIATYEQLIEYCALDMNPRISDVLKGKQKIKEKDLIKISQKLEIPMDYFRRKMKSETRYYVEEYIEEENEEEKKAKIYKRTKKKVEEEKC